MAGKSDVVVRFIGDTTSLDKSIGHAQSGMGKFGGIMSGLGAKIGGEFGTMLQNVGDAMDQLGEKGGKNLGAKLAVGGGAVTALGIAMSTLGSANKQATDQLNAAIQATGKPLDAYREGIDKTIKAQQNLGHSDDDTQDALRKLTQATNDPAIAIKEMGLVANLAAAQHISLSDAAGQVAKVMGGGGRILKQYGIQAASTGNLTMVLTSATKAHTNAVDGVTKANEALSNLEDRLHGKKKLTVSDEQQLVAAHQKVKDAQRKVAESTAAMVTAQKNLNDPLHGNEAALQALSEKLNGQAAASVDNFKGKVEIIRTKLGDWAADMGTKVGPALTTVGPVLMVTGALIQAGTFAWIKNAAAATASGISTVASSIAARVASMAETVAIVALYAAQKAAAVGAKVMAAAQWLVNAAMEANPIGLVIAAIVALIAAVVYAYKHFTWFRDGVQTAFHGIGVAVQWLGGVWGSIWDGIKSVVSDVWSFLKPIIDAIVGGIGKVVGVIGKVGGLLGKGFSLEKKAIGSLIPHFATGTNYAPGGLAKVGENGPEIVELPQGSKVYPHGTGPSTGGGNVFHITAAQDPIGTAMEIARRMQLLGAV